MKLELGYKSSIEVRHEHYRCKVEEAFSMLYISDFHFTAYSGDMVQRLVEKIEELNPDILLLGGDYYDSSTGFYHLCKFMKAISHRRNVFAIAGNHDYFFGIAKTKEVIRENNAYWLEEDSFSLQVNNTIIHIDGNKPQRAKRADINILCLHKPIDLEGYYDHYNVVFAGHLHGSQVVLWQTSKGLYPGRLFYKWNMLKKSVGDCLYLISKGIGDTLPIRYNCKKDIILVNVSS
ncbi:hypothetical protein GXP67_05760 [Rhodocytophaga rosea]|uniref:Calcineurin-like phosphoesterase domain-containing protein n=1 Tax=Rhodocytophaga rosea TaxID=2704465 RepID=A0A6C0GE72_9BACT|nr:metallophosphoesterase [Rhodocytophaga rosea]QHT66207.1 hypothetical protein GXP67_05760 [Rhodocytophaga rosea]